MGDSLVEDDVLDLARDLLQNSGDKLKLPVDLVIADKFDAECTGKNYPGWSSSRWMAHPGYWRKNSSLLWRNHPEIQNDCMEWSDGCL